MNDQQSQLRMGFRRWDALAAPTIAPGYHLRSFRAGDEAAWLALLNQGNFGLWNRERLDAMLGGARAPMPLEGVFFVTRQSAPIGAVCTFFHHTQEGVVPELGWLVVARQHRGRRLARSLCLALLAYVRSGGYDYCYLKTEDFRHAAIATYLAVGFEPEILDDTQPARWALLVSEINSRRARNSASLDTPAD